MPNAVVFDVGGTKIASTVIDEHGRDLLDGDHRHVATPEHVDAVEFTAVMAAEFTTLAQQFEGVTAWGAAFPGPYERLPSGDLQVFPCNIPGVRGANIEQLLRDALNIDGIVDNDLKLAMWGEHLVGALRGIDDAVALVHSTGVSSALMLDGEIVRGKDNNAGEIHCIVSERDSTKARPCDAQDGAVSGHLEGQIRGPALAEIFFGVDRHDKAAVRQALESATDTDLAAIVEYCVPYVASALAPLLQVVCSGHVLLFGGVANWLGGAYTEALTHELTRCSEEFRDHHGRVLLAAQPHLAPLAGAAHRAFERVGVTTTIGV